MENNFLKIIKEGILAEVKRNFDEISSKCKEENLDSLQTLERINLSVTECLKSISSVVKIDDEIISLIANLKKPYITEAKKQVASDVARIIETKNNITIKIEKYMENLKRRGINLDNEPNQDNELKIQREEERRQEEIRKEQEIFEHQFKRAEERVNQRLNQEREERERTLRLQATRRSDDCNCGGNTCGDSGC